MLHAIHTIRHVATTDAAKIDDLLSSTVASLIPGAPCNKSRHQGDQNRTPDNTPSKPPRTLPAVIRF